MSENSIENTKENRIERNYALLIEYNGAGFHGWQVQPKLRTIQQELHETIEKILACPIKKLTASGRTDVGVHAYAQVANFSTAADFSPEKLAYSISGILKPEIVVHKCVEVPLNFNACLNALCKTYRYIILNRKMAAVLDHGMVWHVVKELNLAAMNREAQCLCGKHDFSAFRATGCMSSSPIKIIEQISIFKEDERVIVEIVGSGFLKQMVRNIVGTLVDINKGKLQTSMQEILLSKERTKAGVTAAAQGLYLRRVEYDPDPFA